ncbi:DUF6458 family protein [Planotetraspora sp. A-T 1434]|uniref:DUF6458 family protein n=1 Tax=Planotetraspora sp. A-T 1434 TaxID=2979219 RepID=UPI0021BFB673|nr:DUF6458 family protein [Planotetraspora sp. A-T 1434]MCT9933475.1 DUF6458 family protein [Planotetraspora sp. A-T 1434]
MTIAGSIILIMLGAILTWAVDFAVAGIDIQVIGVILMVGGLAGLLFGIWRLTTVRRTATITPAVPVDEATTHRHVYEERRYTDPI